METLKEVQDRIEKFLKGQRNTAGKRSRLVSCQQQEGENFDEFYIPLLQLANEAELKKMDLEHIGDLCNPWQGCSPGIVGPDILKKNLEETDPVGRQQTRGKTAEGIKHSGNKGWSRSEQKSK